jgi:hypothetical protein
MSDQVEELKQYCHELGTVSELGITYYLLTGLRLPAGCSPTTCDGLLCPSPKDGYASRLYFSQQIVGSFPRNWNGNARIAERNWYAYSWKASGAETLAEILVAHLTGLTRQQ